MRRNTWDMQVRHASSDTLRTVPCVQYVKLTSHRDRYRKIGGCLGVVLNRSNTSRETVTYVTISGIRGGLSLRHHQWHQLSIDLHPSMARQYLA